MTLQRDEHESVAQPSGAGGGPPSQVPGIVLARPRGVRHPLSLAVMSALVPGSGHLVGGRRRTGLVLVVLFLASVAATAAALLLVPREHLVGLAVRPTLLLSAMVAAAVGALVLVAVVLSAYRLGLPGLLPRFRRLVSHVLVGALCVALLVPPAFVAYYADVQRDLISGVFADDEPHALGGVDGQEPGPNPWEGQARLNVLLLGGDGAHNRDGIRSDSINVASIDTETGRTVLFSLPRNLQHARFLAGSYAADQMPDGYPDFFFGVYRFGLEHPSLFPEATDPGAAAVTSAVSQTLGLRVHYYVLVNLHGFRDMVDALGGIRVRVPRPIPVGGIGPDGEATPITDYIEPGLRTLSGYEALWYARSRTYSTDYERMSRQRCVLGALARQADPLTVLKNFRELAAATKTAVATNIPQDRLPDFVSLAQQVKDADIQTVQFVPPLISTGNPDFDLIRAKVRSAIARSTSASPAPPRPTASAAPSVPPTGSPGRQPTPGQPASLDEACAYE